MLQYPPAADLQLIFLLSVLAFAGADVCPCVLVFPCFVRSLDADVMRSHIQKLRSFRYQMKNTLAGDNLDTAEELAQKGILSNGDLGMSLEHRRDGSMSLTRCGGCLGMRFSLLLLLWWLSVVRSFLLFLLWLYFVAGGGGVVATVFVVTLLALLSWFSRNRSGLCSVPSITHTGQNDADTFSLVTGQLPKYVHSSFGCGVQGMARG